MFEFFANNCNIFSKADKNIWNEARQFNLEL